MPDSETRDNVVALPGALVLPGPDDEEPSLLDIVGKDVAQAIGGVDEDLEAIEDDLPGEWGETYWRPPTGGLDWDDFKKLIAVKVAIRKERSKRSSIDKWQLADQLNWGLMIFGHEFYDLFDETHYERDVLGNIARIGAAFDNDRRWDPKLVSFWTHGEVSTLEPMDADDLLEQYANSELTRAELRHEVSLIKKGDSPGASGGKSSKSDDENQGKLLDTCPLCDGLGEVTPDRRKAYLTEEGVSYEAVHSHA